MTEQKIEQVSEFKSLCFFAKQAWMKAKWAEMGQTVKEVAQKHAVYKDQFITDSDSVSLEEMRKLNTTVHELEEQKTKLEQYAKRPGYELFTKDEVKDAVYDVDDQEKIYVYAKSVLSKKLFDLYFSVDRVGGLFQNFDNVYHVFNEEKVNVPAWFASKYPPIATRKYPL